MKQFESKPFRTGTCDSQMVQYDPLVWYEYSVLEYCTVPTASPVCPKDDNATAQVRQPQKCSAPIFAYLVRCRAARIDVLLFDGQVSAIFNSTRADGSSVCGRKTEPCWRFVGKAMWGNVL